MSDLAGIMLEVSQEMQQSLARIRASMQHALSKGEALEDSFREFLRLYLPGSVGVTHGEIIDSNGHRSGQADIILYDQTRTPLFFSSGKNGRQVLPAEGVLAVIEVKTAFTRSDVPDVIKHMGTVKALEKSAYHAVPIVYRTDAYDNTGRDVMPIMYFLVAFESTNPDAIIAAMAHSMSGLAVDKRIDCACMLDGHVIINATSLTADHADDTFSALPAPGSWLGLYSTENALLVWYLAITPWITRWQTPPIDLRRYVPSGVSL